MKESFQIIFLPAALSNGAPVANLLEIRAPFAGTLEGFDIYSPNAAGRPTQFDVTKNGASIFAPGDRPAFGANETRVSKVNLGVVVAKGDVLTISQTSIGTISRRLVFQFDFDDGVTGGGGAGDVTTANLPQKLAGAIIAGNRISGSYDEEFDRYQLDVEAATKDEIYAQVKTILVNGTNTTIQLDEQLRTIKINTPGGGGSAANFDSILTDGGQILVDSETGNIITGE